MMPGSKNFSKLNRMGQTPSRPGSVPIVSQDKEKLDFFSTIFSRLIEKSDIIDLRALTSGPGACGNYVMLLSKNIQTDFKKVKLKSSLSDASLNDFLYSPTQKVIAKTSAKEQACTYLAIFYIRTLQLVAALTMSIYSPPDLISRIAGKVYENALLVEKRGSPQDLSKQAQAKRREARVAWFNRFLQGPTQPGVFMLNDNEQFKYYKVSGTLVFTTYSPQILEYHTRVEIKDNDSYLVADTTDFPATQILSKPDTYWIEITNLYQNLRDRVCIYRVLVDGTGQGWRFLDSPDLKAVKEEYVEGPFSKWDYGLEDILISSPHIDGVAPSTKVENTSIGYQQFGRFSSKFNSKFRSNQTKRVNNVRNNKTIKNNVKGSSLGLSDKTQLPVKYQNTYKTMTTWWESVKLSHWPEAAPASFRATLLYNKPTVPTDFGSTYICDDIWAEKRLRTVPPFAALEALYYNRDDGTPDVENVKTLAKLSAEFNTIYENASQGITGRVKNTTKSISDFADIFVPADSTALRSRICANTSAQGESQITNMEIATILSQAQNEIIEKYKVHVDAAYTMLKTIFEIGIINGETVIKFTDNFTASPKGVRARLEEEVIPNARTLIANHYIEVEEVYYTALSAISKKPWSAV